MDDIYNSLLDLPTTAISTLLNQSFQGYVVDIRFDPILLASIIRADSIDLASSRRVQVDGEDAGIALIARRGNICRVAAMAIRPEARGQGVGRRLMEQVIADARIRGETTMTLEVVEQNPVAIRLYEGLAFRRVRRLVGYSCEPVNHEGPAIDGLEEIEMSDVATEVMAHLPDLPWQISGATLAHLAFPNRAFRLGHACTVVSDPNQPTVSLRAIFVSPDKRRQGEGRRLIETLQSRFPDRTWRISPVVPDGLADVFFHAVGFKTDSLSQFQKQLDL